MRGVLVCALVAACGFEIGTTPLHDATGDDTSDGTGDAAVDAPPDAPPDARMCPAAPSGCTAFTCPGSASCYYACGQSTKRSWTSANTTCMSQNTGCLATIDNAAENACVLAATAPQFPDLVWIGWVQSSGGSEPGGGWGWTCGSSSFVAGNWGDPQGEPNNEGGNEDCGALIQGGAWIDGGCSTTLRFVCELP